MTYFGFLLRFVFIPILLLLAIALWDSRQGRQINGFLNGKAVWLSIAVHVVLAVAYTTPWDNYLVATGVWYYNPDLVTGIVIGYVPIEEYTFFVAETILAGLWWWFLARRFYHLPLGEKVRLRENFIPNKRLIHLSTSVIALLWLVFTYLFFFGDVKWTYLSIILFWALPVVFIQMLFGADILWHHRKLVFWAIIIPGTYLSLMDIIALRATTWSVSPVQTTGILFFEILPLEEATFFFATNIMITFGMTLLLSEASHQRIEKWNLRRLFSINR